MNQAHLKSPVKGCITNIYMHEYRWCSYWNWYSGHPLSEPQFMIFACTITWILICGHIVNIHLFCGSVFLFFPFSLNICLITARVSQYTPAFWTPLLFKHSGYKNSKTTEAYRASVPYFNSVSPACRKRRLNGAPLYISRWYGVKQ